ncbi:ATP-binding cassette domain-containing protein [Collinsella phocaeensis]|uniref:ATP-binding cassette domain-containing protein n=1 Tax=Collinsella phocaeensis TaxID=1871016 RepID=UPI0009302349|nr:ABC transporter ATP-binding protein [Collinsella phocaeensis]
MLSVSHLTLSYRGGVLLDDVSFGLEPGRIMGLVAPNGYGKTTLLKAMAGIKGARVSGIVDVDGLPANQVARRRARVFYAPGEGTLLYPGMTVAEHLAMTRKLWKSERDPADVARACRIDGFLGKRVRACSQGMKQQLTLAIAYMTGARYLLLDEPMNALDPTNVQLNSRILRGLAQRGAGVLMSSHILENVDQLSDEILFVRDGKLVMFDPDAGPARALDIYNQLYL